MTAKPSTSASLLTTAASAITTLSSGVTSNGNDALTANQEATLTGVIRDLNDILYVRRKVAGAS
jgi:hypothetical protein